METLIDGCLQSFPAYVKELHPKDHPNHIVVAYQREDGRWGVEFVDLDYWISDSLPPYVGMRGQLLKNLIGIISFTFCPDHQILDQDEAS